jgi:hypothetical protein
MRRYTIFFPLSLLVSVQAFVINVQDQVTKINNTFLPSATDLLAGKSNFDLLKHNGASVLPITTMPNKKLYVVLGHETRGYWDDFGGKADPDENPLQTAARELLEEMLLQETLGYSAQEVMNYVALDNNNTHRIICYANPLTSDYCFTTYITFIPFNLITTIFQKFPQASTDPKLPSYKQEKTKLCLVSLEDFFTAINQAKNTNAVFVKAFVSSKDGKALRAKKIKLRPFLVQKLKQYASKKEPSRDMGNQKILFYEQDKVQKHGLLFDILKKYNHLP